MTKELTPIVGDLVLVGIGRLRRSGKVIKVLPPKHPSPGGYVVDNETTTFYVAPWESISALTKGGVHI
jgi:hypothetical protein